MTERQRQALEAVWQYDYVLYGGARGGGKSWFLRWCAVMLGLWWGIERKIKRVRIGLFCETYPTLKDRQISKIKAEFPEWLGQLRDSQDEGLCFFMADEFGGARIALRNLDDPQKYKSSEFAAILVDQLEENTLDTFNTLRGSKRWPGIEHTKFIAGANPGGIGHGWVKAYWIDKDYPPELRKLAPQFCFVPALAIDNPHLPSGYWDELGTLDEALRKAWLEGNWNVFEGQAFPKFRRDRHVIEPVELPTWWPRWRAIDWGYAKPFCCLWVCKDPDRERIYVYKEAYEVQLTDQQQAKLIKDTTLAGERILVSYADPSLWETKNMEGKVSSTAQEYKDNGVPLEKADNARLAGKRKIDRLLLDMPDEKPGLLVFDNCTNLIRTLPALPRDKTNPEDVDTHAEDHAYDALRYALTNYEAQRGKSEEQRIKEENQQRQIADARRAFGW